MEYAVLTQDMLVLWYYEISSTDLAYAATRHPSQIPSAAICAMGTGMECYAMSGTERAYAATRCPAMLLPGGGEVPITPMDIRPLGTIFLLSCYASPTKSLVLIWRMLLPGRGGVLSADVAPNFIATVQICYRPTRVLRPVRY
eukprot:3920213-Rhodomonas_salina.4